MRGSKGQVTRFVERKREVESHREECIEWKRGSGSWTEVQGARKRGWKGEERGRGGQKDGKAKRAMKRWTEVGGPKGERRKRQRS